jgi:hypothetical protein
LRVGAAKNGILGDMRVTKSRILIYTAVIAIVSSLLTGCGGGSYCEKLQSAIEKDSEERVSIPFTPNRKYFDVLLNQAGF